MREIGVAALVMAGMFVLTITLAVVLDKPEKPIQKPIKIERVIWV